MKTKEIERKIYERVVVNVWGRDLTYGTAGIPLSKGDRVLVPGSWVPGHELPEVGIVTATKSDYDGSVRCIIKRID